MISIILAVFTSLSTFAAPNPGMGSALLSQKYLGRWQTSEGITFTAKQEEWKLDGIESLQEELKTPFRLVSTTNSEATLAFHTDKLKRGQSIDGYIRHWVKEYQYFGFEILKTSPAQIVGDKGYVIDLYHKKNSKQVRQFLAQNSGVALVITCTDSLASFQKSVAKCHEVYKTIKWQRNKMKPLSP